MSVALAFAFFLAAVGLAVAYGMTNREHPTPLYDWQAGDFPAYLAEHHNPLTRIERNRVIVVCSCRQYRHIEPIHYSANSAHAVAVDEFWTTHTSTK